MRVICDRCGHDWHGLNCIWPLVAHFVVGKGKPIEEYRTCGCSSRWEPA